MCYAPIAWRYPLVEASTGVMALWLFWVYGPTWGFSIAFGFGMALIVLFFTDFDHQILPDLVTLTGFAVGVAVAWFNPFLGGIGWSRIWSSMAGAAIGAGVLWGIGAIYGRLRGVEAMGLGDVKMMAMVGAFTGPKGVLFTLFVASLLGAVVGLALIPLRGRTLKDALPFGCFLAPAAFAALVVGRQAVEMYLQTVHYGP
jgi:leader peptidase (prepilin peptidase)/N-methyltransferase